jgi:hypothetical protein
MRSPFGLAAELSPLDSYRQPGEKTLMTILLIIFIVLTPWQATHPVTDAQKREFIGTAV